MKGPPRANLSNLSIKIKIITKYSQDKVRTYESMLISKSNNKIKWEDGNLLHCNE